jgi:phospholipid transport system substrate-binding protein
MGRALVAGTRQALAMLGMILILGAFAGLPLVARAGSPEPSIERAEGLVHDLAREAWNLLEADLDDGARVDQLAHLIESRTDVDLLSRLVLGRHWRDLADAQRTGYQELFRAVVIRNLALRLDRYARDTPGKLDDHFQITGSSPVGKGDVLVRSKIRPATGEPVDVDWRLRDHDGQPVIIDLIVAGVSLLVSQRSEFAAVIERSSIDGLLTELRARAEGTAS